MADAGEGGTVAPAPAPGGRRAHAVGIAAPGILLGVGLGGFVDGIVLHQILQWHHMVTGPDSRFGLPYHPADTLDGLRANALADGLFHAATWLAVLAGLVLLYRRVRAPRRRVWGWRALWGWLLTGWGLFNLVEGLVNHHLLRIHHVRDGPDRLWWDLGFLGLGAVLVGAGWLLRRGARPVDLDDGHAQV